MSETNTKTKKVCVKMLSESIITRDDVIMKVHLKESIEKNKSSIFFCSSSYFILSVGFVSRFFVYRTIYKI